ncbi:MAG: DinB family protein [Terriglobales bacterium]
MSTATTMIGEAEVLRHSFRTTQQVLRMNLEGITQEESLVPPNPAGNCLNWIVGHLLCVYNDVLPLVGQQPVMAKESLQRYGRGTPPLRDASEALPLAEMLSKCDEAVNRFEAGLETLTHERLDLPAPFSPTQNPNETVRSLLATVAFHQAYHAGQTGVLRRIIGKPGTIA